MVRSLMITMYNLNKVVLFCKNEDLIYRFYFIVFFFFFSSRRRHTRYWRDWSSDVCSSDLLALADRDRGRIDRRQVEAGVPRVVDGERAVLGERGAHEPSQLLLVLRRRHDQVRQLALGRDREHALVARAVLADEARAIHADHYRSVVLAHVVHRLVERALQERRVDRHERPLPAEREARRKRD